MSVLDASTLRPLTVNDLPMVLEWRNQDRVRQNMYNSHVISSEEHRAWFDRLDRRTNRYFVFELDRRPAGMSYFTKVDEDQARAEWGFYLGGENPPRGVGTIMGALSLDLGFDQLNLHKVYGEVLHFNKASQKFFERLGFICDGTLREHFCREKRRYDVVLFSQLANEWREQNRDSVYTMIERFHTATA